MIKTIAVCLLLPFLAMACKPSGGQITCLTLKGYSPAFPAAVGTWSGVTGSIASGTPTLIMDAACLVASDVGRAVIVLNATAVSGILQPFRTTIVSIDGTNTIATLAANASAPVSGGEVIFSPSVDFMHEDAANITNDFTARGLRILHVKGCGMYFEGGVNVWLPELKIHGRNGTTGGDTSSFAMVTANLQARINMELSGTWNNPKGKIHNSGGVIGIDFESIATSIQNDLPVIYSENCKAGAPVRVGSLFSATAFTSERSVRGLFVGVDRVDGPVAVYNADYDPDALSKIKHVFGNAYPPAAALVGKINVADDSTAPIQTMVSGGGTGVEDRSYSYGGTFAVPATLSSFQPIKQHRYYGYNGTSLVEAARITVRAKNVTGAVIASDILIATRNLADVFANRWSFDSEGGILPLADNAYDVGWSGGQARNIYFGNNLVPSKTITAGGTTGAQTINKPAGTVNFAAGASTLVVTNSLVTANSFVYCTIRTGDATALIKNVVPVSGSFTITLNAAATAETSVAFLVVN